VSVLERRATRAATREPAEGNARLTTTTSLVLLVLLAVQVTTAVLGVQSHLTLHVVVGLLLVPPLLVKIASVAWRFLRYYRHDAEYRRKGPPPLALRVLGPLLLLTTLVLFTSGITLVLAPTAFGGPHGMMFQIHGASFYLWMLLILAHVAGHARDLRRLSARDWMRRTRSAVPGARARQAVALAGLAAGLALALALAGHAGTYQSDAHHAVTAMRHPGTTAPGALARTQAKSASTGR
jgi:hypothetical protein